MDEPQRAKTILERARDVLIERLSQSIIEGEERILEDAEGDSYMDEINTLHETIGRKLSQLNSMIDGLPAARTEEVSESIVVNLPNYVVDSESLPDTDDFRIASLPLFAGQVAANDMDAAGQTLSELLEVEAAVGMRCACAFREQLDVDPAIMDKVLRLGKTLSAGRHQDSLMILWDCFALHGSEAAQALEKLKTRVGSN